MGDTKIIAALDFPSKKEAFEFLDKFNEPIYVKIGMELFYKEGPEIIRKIKERGHGIFLDLKLHDIPNTVKSAMRNLASLDVDMVNVHAAGGKKMMAAAIEGLEEGSAGGKRPLCIAVTQLTSTGPEMLKDELLIEKDSFKIFSLPLVSVKFNTNSVTSALNFASEPTEDFTFSTFS